MTIDEYQYAMPLTDDHLKALGRIVAESSLLESVIEISIWETLKLPYQVGQQLTTNPNLGQLVNTLLSIMPQVLPDKSAQTDFGPIAQELKAVLSLRNYLIHSYWTFGATQNKPVSLNFRNDKGNIVPRSKPWTPEQLERVAARISRVGDELELFLRSHGAGMPQPLTRDWRPFQVPPEPKWQILAGREPKVPPRSSPAKPPTS